MVKWDSVKPQENLVPSSLCSRCEAIGSTILFDSEIDITVLQTRSQICHICKLLFETLPQRNLENPKVIKLRQDGAVVGVEDGPDLLSIYTAPGMWLSITES